MEDGSCRLPMVRGLIAEEEEGRERERERLGLVVVARCRPSGPSRWSIALVSLVTLLVPGPGLHYTLQGNIRDSWKFSLSKSAKMT